jgi:general stress protein 26
VSEAEEQFMSGTLRVILAAAGLLLTSHSFAQAASAAPDRATVLEAAKDVMAKAAYCALITVGDEGQPQARVVDPFAPESDLTVWIATKPVTRKVAQIKKNDRVTLFYFDREGMGYVTLIGRAQLVTDAAEKAKHWKETWAAFYDDKNHGPDYLLIRVKPTHLEMVSYAHGLTGDAKTWRPIEMDMR